MHELRGIFGTNLRRVRKRLKLSQADLGKLCGFHRTYIGAIERGERNITIDSIERISDTLGLDPAELLSKE